MKIRKNTFKNAILTSLMLSAVIISGCSFGSDNGSGASGDKITITVAHTADPVESENVLSQVAIFNEQNPDINLVAEPIAGDIWEVLKTRMASGNAPDVFYMDIFQAQAFIDAGKLMSVENVYTEDELSDFFVNLVDAFRGQDGVLYGIPKDYSTLGLYYNKDMFDEAGLEPPKTWDELMASAKALTKGDVIGLSLQNELPRVGPLFYSNGGNLMKDGKPTLNDPLNVEAYEFWLSLFKEGVAKTPADIGVGWDGDAFAQESVAMTIEGTWMVQSLLQAAPDLNYGVVPVPISKEDASMQFTVAYSISSDTKHPEEAQRVVKFLTSPEMQQMVVTTGTAVPSRISMAQEYVESYPERKVFVDVVEFSHPFEYGIISQVVVDQAGKAFERLLLGQEMDVQKAFDDAQAEIDKALGKQ